MILYWLLFPLAFGALLLGLGLGLRRLSVPFPAPLLLPAGYAVAIVTTCALCLTPATTWLAGPAVIALALAGWFFGYRDLVAPGALRRHAPWIAAGLAAFLVFGFSSIVVGHPTFTGASQIVDIGHQFDMSWYAGEQGRSDVEWGISSALNVVEGALPLYPWGPQSLLGTFPKTIGMELFWAWQPMLAILAGNLVVAAYALLRQVTGSRRFAAVGAFAAGQASALIGYGQIGGIKELAAIGLLLAAAAFTTLLGDPDRPAWRTVLPVTVAAAGAFSVFSLTLVPWLALTVLGGLVVASRSVSVRTAALRGGWALAIGALISIPTIIPALRSFAYADQMGDADQVGNLAHPLSRWAVTGIWFSPDHRFALEGGMRTLSIVVGCLVLALAAVGLATAVRRRAFPILIATAGASVTFVYLVTQMGPWVELKGIVLTSVVVLTLACVGLTVVLTVERLRWVAWAAAVGLVVAGLFSDGLRFGSTQVASNERYSELGQIDDAYAGVTNALHPDWDEQAEYQLRKVRGAAPFNFPFTATSESAAKLSGGDDRRWDLDEIDPTFLQGFQLLLPRRGPGLSRPPQNYDLVEQRRFYDVWKRGTGAAPTDHLALKGAADPRGQATCQAYLATKGQETVTIAPASAPIDVPLDPNASTKGWLFRDGNTTASPGDTSHGQAVGTVTLPQAGRYEISLTTNSARKVTLTVDGRAFPSPQADRTYVVRGRYVETVSLGAGRHTVKIAQARAGLWPGGATVVNRATEIGPVSFVAAGQVHPALIRGKASDLTCPPSPDWVETP